MQRSSVPALAVPWFMLVRHVDHIASACDPARTMNMDIHKLLNQLPSARTHTHLFCPTRSVSKFRSCTYCLLLTRAVYMLLCVGCLSCSIRLPEMHLHTEEVVHSLVRMRRKQLQMAAAVEAARHQQDGEEPQDTEPSPDLQEL